MSEVTDASVHGEQFVVPDGWTWTLVDVACDACGAVNQLHEQPPEWLAQPEGVKWECTSCGAANTLGGNPPVALAAAFVECGECHATFDGREGSPLIDVDESGAWVCPHCSTSNRDVTAQEAVSSTESQQVTP